MSKVVVFRGVYFTMDRLIALHQSGIDYKLIDCHLTRGGGGTNSINTN